MPFTALTYGDPKIINPTLVASVALTFGLVFAAAATPSNYGWWG